MPLLRLRSILAVVTDPFATEQPAAMKAAALARRAGARLILLNTFMIPQPVNDVPMGSHREIIASATRERAEKLEKLAAKLRKQKVNVRVVVEWDYPSHEAIIRAVRRESADLLVAHSHRHGRLARWLLANTDWELIRHCPCPVWFVKTGALPKHPKLLVAVDPTHANAKPARLDDRLMTAATEIANGLDGSVDLAHAYRARLVALSDTSRKGGGRPSAALEAPDFSEHAVKTVRSLAARFGIDAEHCHLIHGEPAEVLPRLVAQRVVDVLVMGAVSRSVTARAVIGNTAEKVIDSVECDVLVVKPARFKTSIPRSRSR